MAENIVANNATARRSSLHGKFLQAIKQQHVNDISVLKNKILELQGCYASAVTGRVTTHILVVRDLRPDTILIIRKS